MEYESASWCWLKCLVSSYEAWSLAPQVWWNTIPTLWVDRPTYWHLRPVRVLLQWCCSNQSRNLVGLSLPFQAASKSGKEAGQEISPHSWWVVACLGRRGRTWQVPARIGVPSLHKDPTSVQRLISVLVGLVSATPGVPLLVPHMKHKPPTSNSKSQLEYILLNQLGIWWINSMCPTDSVSYSSWDLLLDFSHKYLHLIIEGLHQFYLVTVYSLVIMKWIFCIVVRIKPIKPTRLVS